MEHYDWNEGWLFAPTFDPALVRPECPELSLTPVRLPHTVKPLPYNYCNENDYQRLCGYRREGALKSFSREGLYEKTKSRKSADFPDLEFKIILPLKMRRATRSA